MVIECHIQVWNVWMLIHICCATQLLGGGSFFIYSELFLFFYWSYRRGNKYLSKQFAGLVCVYKHTVIECHVQVWNVWMLILFVVPLNCQGGGALNSEFFFFDALHLQIIAKASVEFISPVSYFLYTNHIALYMLTLFFVYSLTVSFFVKFTLLYWCKRKTESSLQ